jgi:hypothetical protein
MYTTLRMGRILHYWSQCQYLALFITQLRKILQAWTHVRIFLLYSITILVKYWETHCPQKVWLGPQ